MSGQLLVGTRKGLFTYEQNGAGKWSIVGRDFLGVPVPMLFADPRDGARYAALDHGHFGMKLHKSDDGGATWREIAVPEYPPQPEGEVDLHPFTKLPIPWKLKLIWALEAAGGDAAPGALWCGTLPGGLFYSPDGGASWEIVRELWEHPLRRKWMGGGADLPGIHSICVDPRDPQVVRIGVSTGGMWETRDGGKSWACRAEGMRAEYMPPEQAHEGNVQDVHRLVQCAADPETLWVQHHNGIFRTTDGGASWQELKDVSPAVFGFAVVVHPQDPNTAWFVPAQKDEFRIPVEGKVVVTRTRDGGQTFETLRNGLPQQDAYDLVFRHGLDIAPQSLQLAFGSTTGSLWISDDQGDRWQTLSEHLPPIYCVRFTAEV